jgi:hypothetical protein
VWLPFEGDDCVVIHVFGMTQISIQKCGILREIIMVNHHAMAVLPFVSGEKITAFTGRFH